MTSIFDVSYDSNFDSDSNSVASENQPLETFGAYKAIFSSSVAKNTEVYVPETSCMKGTSVHMNNMAL